MHDPAPTYSSVNAILFSSTLVSYDLTISPRSVYIIVNPYGSHHHVVCVVRYSLPTRDSRATKCRCIYTMSRQVYLSNSRASAHGLIIQRLWTSLVSSSEEIIIIHYNITTHALNDSKRNGCFNIIQKLKYSHRGPLL